MAVGPLLPAHLEEDFEQEAEPLALDRQPAIIQAIDADLEAQELPFGRHDNHRGEVPEMAAPGIVVIGMSKVS